MQDKVFLTGATGFVGTNILLKLIEKDIEIYALTHRNPIKVHHKKIKILNSSLDKLNELKNQLPSTFNAVIHCAGLTKSYLLEEFYKVNFLGTRNLIEFFINNNINIHHFIYISSISTCGPCKEKKPANEDTQCHPLKGYGESKLFAENEVRKLPSNINWTILRPPFVFGPYDYDTLYIFKMIKYGIKLYTGAKFFSFVYAEDLADIVVKIIGNSQAFGKTYFVSYPEYTSQINFVNTIAMHVNKNAKLIRVHPSLLVSLASLLQPFLNKTTPINRIKFKEIKHSYWLCSPEKIKNELSLECKTSLVSAIKKTYEWYRKNNLI